MGTGVPMANNILALWVWRKQEDDVDPLFLVTLIQLELLVDSIQGGGELQPMSISEQNLNCWISL